MSDVAIKFENISKQYRLGLVSTRTLSHDLNRWWQTSILRKEDPYLKIGESNNRAVVGTSEYVWALKDINLEVKQGDVLGIIGSNGAGKSTLLKILSKITNPTTGSIKAKGRVASLLEVGTGFHPDLTGRENIYMNGSIIGMNRKEINRKLDEIVAFSGIARYIDTPVKRYSSGMIVRLGFSVAAHLDPEILVVDEVLAVGDVEFQRKAIGKMKDVSKGEGRTVLFVSHNLPAIKALCSTGYVLKNGGFDFYGTAEDAIVHFQSNFNENKSFEMVSLGSQDLEKMLEQDAQQVVDLFSQNLHKAAGTDSIKIINLYALPLRGNYISISSGVLFELYFYNNRADILLDISFQLRTVDGVLLFHHGTLASEHAITPRGYYRLRGALPSNFLNTGHYNLSVKFGADMREVLFEARDFVKFEIQNDLALNETIPGVVRPNMRYVVDYVGC